MTEEEQLEKLRKQPGRMNRSVRTSTNGNGWAPRKTETLTCPSGQVAQVRRPGPEFMLKAAKVAQTFSKYVTGKVNSEESPGDAGLNVIENMSDEELAAVMIFARELVCAMLVSPKLVKEPRPGTEEVGPNDIPDADFWFLWNYAMGGYFNLKVPVGVNEEVEIGDLESFRPELGVSGDSVDGPEVRAEAEQPS